MLVMAKVTAMRDGYVVLVNGDDDGGGDVAREADVVDAAVLLAW
jgi:hypothetical protein